MSSSQHDSTSVLSSPLISETHASDNRIVEYFVDPETHVLRARTRELSSTSSSSSPSSLSSLSAASTSAPSYTSSIFSRFHSALVTRPKRALIKTFLPVDYPHSVAPWYGRYALWQFVQSLVGSAQWVLTTNAMLVGVGLTADPTTLTAWSVTLNWVLKDGIGALGMIFFVRLLGTWLDTDTKRMMWRADLLHNLGSALELLIPFFAHIFGFFLLTASTANLIKGVAALSAGACRAAILKAVILRENFAEVTAKTHTQSVLAYVLGMILGIGVSTFLAFVSTSPLFVWPFFFFFGGVHLFCSYQKLNAVTFTTLNLQRASLVLETYFREGRVMAPHELRDERIVRRPRYRQPPRLVFCSSVARAFGSASEVSDARGRCSGEKFLLHVRKRSVFVLLHRDATPTDELRALFAACHLQYTFRTQSSLSSARSQQTIRATNNNHDSSIHTLNNNIAVEKSLEVMRREFALFITSLQTRGWNTNETVLHGAGPRYF